MKEPLGAPVRGRERGRKLGRQRANLGQKVTHAPREDSGVPQRTLSDHSLARRAIRLLDESIHAERAAADG